MSCDKNSSQQADDSMLRNCRHDIHGKKEKILRKDRHPTKSGAGPIAWTDSTCLLDPSPRNVDVK